MLILLGRNLGGATPGDLYALMSNLSGPQARLRGRGVDGAMKATLQLRDKTCTSTKAMPSGGCGERCVA